MKTIFVTFFVLLSVVKATEFYDLCDQLAGALGYPCEHVNVTTADGWVLDTIHITPKQQTGAAYPIVLQHGLVDSAVTWFVNPHPEQNLACILHDQGYDVWIPNSRGNHYSMTNLNTTSSNSFYWYSIDCDEMAAFDLAGVIDHVLAATKQPTLSWVGHSQGTWQAFSAFSLSRKNYANKVDVFVALAPVARVKYTSAWLLRLLADLDVGVILTLFGMKEFLANDWLLRQFGKICPGTGEFCGDLLDMICGYGNNTNINQTQIPTILRYDPAGTSVNNMIHWAQAVRTGAYQMHDYGWDLNEQFYHSPTPPVYNLSAMTGPKTVLLYGGDDSLADQQDVDWLIAQLPVGTVVGKMFVPNYAHLDFVWGMDAHRRIYPYIVAEIEKYKRK